MKKLVASVDSTADIVDIKVFENFNAATSRATVVARTTTLNLNDAVTITAGTADNNGVVFTGFVKSIEKQYPPSQVIIECQDVLDRAMNKFLVPIPSAKSYGAVTGGYPAEGIVSSLLYMAFLGRFNSQMTAESIPFTDFVYDPTDFHFADANILGTPNMEIRLETVFDQCKKISDLLNWRLWADHLAVIHFEKRPHYPDTTSPVSDPATPAAYLQFSLANRNMLRARYAKSTDNLRNQVGVLGRGDLQSNQQASSAYLPAAGGSFRSFYNGQTYTYPSDFHQATVIGSEWLTNQTICDSAASVNLARLNRLTETGTLVIPGDQRVHARQICSVSGDLIADMSGGNWFIYGMTFTWNKGAFEQELTLTR